MIYYFSGTGNSRFVADRLSSLLIEECRRITDVKASGEEVQGESVGFVFPVYSWGVAPLVIKFIDSLLPSFWDEVIRRQMPVWCVMTCGDEVALAPEMFAETVRRHGVEPESMWSVIMPNNYVLLPGFDVDSSDVERHKLEDADGRIREIARGIRQHSKSVDVVRGSLAWVKTKIVYPLFCKWGISPKKWYTTLGCVGCGICAGACPLKNVKMVCGLPEWGNDCCSCLACYHSCPRHAVAYGKATFKKGQYYFDRFMSRGLKRNRE